MNTIRPFLLLLVAAAAARGVGASDWSRFRGPNGSGVGEATGLPVAFGSGVNRLWTTPLPPGHSSPVLGAGRVFVTAFEKDRLATIALDAATGAVRWRRELERGRIDHFHANNNPAAPSPVTDGANVWVFFGEFGLVSYTAEGAERWRVPLGPFRNYKGMGASPILAGGLVVLVCDQDVGSFMVGVDADRGVVRWRTERPEIPGNGHATPAVYEGREGTQVVVVGGGQVAGYRVDTGAKVWWVGGLSIQPKASPVVAADGSVYVLAPGSGEGASGGIEPFAQLAAKLDKNGDGKLTTEELGSYNQADSDGDGVMTEREYRTFLSGGQIPSALLAIDPAGQGDRTASGVRWRYARGLPLVPSPLVYGGVLYLLKEGGILTALDPATGTVLKQARLLGALDAYFASPVGADGKLYCASQTGHVAVVRAGPELELLGVNDLDDECFATPAVAPGRLYVRTRRGLHCFGAQAQSAAPAALRAGR